jgi:hypothetical protein
VVRLNSFLSYDKRTCDILRDLVFQST